MRKCRFQTSFLSSLFLIFISQIFSGLLTLKLIHAANEKAQGQYNILISSYLVEKKILSNKKCVAGLVLHTSLYLFKFYDLDLENLMKKTYLKNKLILQAMGKKYVGNERFIVKNRKKIEEKRGSISRIC